MTQEMYVALLKQGHMVWNDWRNNNPKIRPDLSCANLIRVDLSRANLRWVNLSQANLSLANLTAADLSRANLSQTNLDSATLIRAKLEGVNFSQAYLNWANLSQAILWSANLSQAYLNQSNLVKAELMKANFYLADLRYANLSEANFSNYHSTENEENSNQIDLHGAILNRANFSFANLGHANMAGLHLNQINLEGATLTEANLKSAILNEVNLSDANLHQANLTAANVSGSNLHGANLRKSKLIKADFSKTNLSEADLSGSEVSGTKFVRANLISAKLDNWLTDSETDFKDAIASEELASKFSQMYVQYDYESKKIQLLSGKASNKTILLEFADGIDWSALSEMLQLLQDRYSGEEIGIHSFETMQDYGLRIYLTLPDTVSAVELKGLAWEFYNHCLKKLELEYLFDARMTEEEMLVHRRDNTNLLKVLQRLASPPGKTIKDSTRAAEAILEKNEERSLQKVDTSKLSDKEPVSSQTYLTSDKTDFSNHRKPSIEDNGFDKSKKTQADGDAEAGRQSESSESNSFQSTASESNSDKPNLSKEESDNNGSREKSEEKISDKRINDATQGIDAYIPPTF